MFFGGDPFEHFHHRGSGRSHRSAASVDTTKLYETLGVSRVFRQEECCERSCEGRTSYVYCSVIGSEIPKETSQSSVILVTHVC